MPPPPPLLGGVGNISWKGTSRFNWGRGGGGSDGETSFLSGRGAPHGEDIGFDGGFLKKIVGWGEGAPPHHHKSVNTSLKLILLLEVSLEKHIKSIIV